MSYIANHYCNLQQPDCDISLSSKGRVHFWEKALWDFTQEQEIHWGGGLFIPAGGPEPLLGKDSIVDEIYKIILV